MKTLKCFISFPNDVAKEVILVEEIFNNLNIEFQRDYNLKIQTYTYQKLPPSLNGNAVQEVIESMIKPSDCEIVIGIFWKRLGTPTNGYNSGSEYEIKSAVNKVKAEGEGSNTRVMVYFSKVKFSEDEVDTVQLGRLKAFKEECLQMGLYQEYHSEDQFVTRVSDDVKQYIQLKYADFRSTSLELRSIPSFSGILRRNHLFEEVKESINSGPIFILEGLSGTGKTYLVSSFLKENATEFNRDYTFWYTADEGDTLERLLISLGEIFQFHEESPLAKFKHTLKWLKKHNGLLVIDNFHYVDSTIRFLLLSAAHGLDCKAILILVSAKNASIDLSFDPIRKTINGYTEEELEKLLHKHGIEMSTDNLEYLHVQTGGLPVLIKLFIHCVNNSGYHTKELLEIGVADRSEYIKWYNKLTAKLKEDERNLLSYLSVCDSSFDMAVITQISKFTQIQNCMRAFEGLQRALLIDNSKISNWTVHKFIRDRAIKNVPLLTREKVIGAIAGEYQSRVSTDVNHKLTSDDLISLIQAGRYFKRIGMNGSTRNIIDRIRNELKIRGDYGTLYELTTPDDADYNRDNWLDYHYIESCLILGKFKEAKSKILDIYKDVMQNGEIDKLLVTKCYAEVENIYKNHQFALKLLEEVEINKAWKNAERHIKDMVTLYKINTLIRLDNFSKAGALSERIYKRNKNKNNYTKAVISALIATQKLKSTQYHDVDKYSKTAMLFFDQRTNKRGLAWANELLALYSHQKNDKRSFFRYTFEALQKRSHLTDCSLEYFDFINKLEEILPNEDLSILNSEVENLIHSEIRRMRHIYEEIKK